MLKRILKLLLLSASLLAAFPAALLCGFGRWRGAFLTFAQAYSLFPGLPGDYLRVAFYRLTLAECSLASRVSFGTFFSYPGSKLGAGAYIGSYCVIGTAFIGESVQIASGVQILSGARQHERNEDGGISGAEEGAFQTVTIGAHCWIGAAAVVMADVGEGSTVGAGAVVTRPIPPRSVAVGVPARPMNSNSAAAG